MVSPTKVNAAKTHCKYGPPLSGDNLYITYRGRRSCKACQNRMLREHRRRLRDARGYVRPPRTFAERFEASIAPVPGPGCWLWTGAWMTSGYGQLHLNGKRGQGAHRAAYEFFVGPIPAGMLVCHKCDTPACVNPDHLFLGTVSDNNQDMIRKGRARLFGRRSPATGATT